ncbi:MAG: AraC family transcriptional regulator [Rhizobiales bacterium PAR1]|nr:MAG: AraC family transcriptional regulator [Rhizobiales bacterium PAR1]
MTTSPITPFDDALADLRISGSVLLFESYQPPWAIDVPDETVLRSVLGLSRNSRVIPFHLVRCGTFELHHTGQVAVSVTANEVAICPSGRAHRMSRGEGARETSIVDILLSGGSSALEPGQSGETTDLLCGIFVMENAPLNPLLAALPPVVKIDTRAEINPMLGRVAEMLSHEVSRGQRSGFTACRLLEIFFAETVQDIRKTESQKAPGWFRALEDTRIAPALSALHRDPGAAWTVESLAAAVAMSPSRFAARFREATGQSLMAYVSRWRMVVACRFLGTTGRGLSDIAAEVGYTDVAAFSRAFKVIVGVSPARWRNEKRQGEAAPAPSLPA